MEDSYQEEQQSKQLGQDQGNFQQEGTVKHRRKKNEIEKDYICGDPNCGRRYGTNAALYTHIKNKHSGIAPQGTIKPSSQQKRQSVQKSDSQIMQQSGNNENAVPPSQNKEEDEKNEIFDIITNKEYLDFTYKIGKLGELKDSNIFVRDSTDEYYTLKEEQIQEYYAQIAQKIQMSTEIVNEKQLQKQVAQFLVQASPYWKKNIIKELYFFLLYSYIMEGNSFQSYVDEINTSPTQNQHFLHLFEQKGAQLSDIYGNIWKQFIEGSI